MANAAPARERALLNGDDTLFMQHLGRHHPAGMKALEILSLPVQRLCSIPEWEKNPRVRR